MKIIVEGMDNVGKTTLINKIIKMCPDMNFKVIHGTKDTPNNFEYYKRILLSNENLIVDRAWVGQFIYQSQRERSLKGWLSESDRLVIESSIYNGNVSDVVCLYVTAPIDLCYEMCKQDPQDHHYTRDYIRILNSRYEHYMNNSMIPWIKINNDFSDNLSLEDEKRSSSSIDEKNIDYSSIPYTVAVDFDGTLFDNAFPDITKAVPNEELIKSIKQMNNERSTRLILWTNRSGKALEEALLLCKLYGLTFDAINDNIDEVKQLGLDPRKVWANLYIDDKAVCNRFTIEFDKEGETQ